MHLYEMCLDVLSLPYIAAYLFNFNFFPGYSNVSSKLCSKGNYEERSPAGDPVKKSRRSGFKSALNVQYCRAHHRQNANKSPTSAFMRLSSSGKGSFTQNQCFLAALLSTFWNCGTVVPPQNIIIFILYFGKIATVKILKKSASYFQGSKERYHCENG